MKRFCPSHLIEFLLQYKSFWVALKKMWNIMKKISTILVVFVAFIAQAGRTLLLSLEQHSGTGGSSEFSVRQSSLYNQ
jgi:hypothetical protein